MKKVILHIGSPKCATSAIQTSLFKNKETLTSHGVLYPTNGLGDKGNGHHNLGYQLSKSTYMTSKFNPKNGGWEDLVKELHQTDFECAIISTETLFRKQQHIINAIADHLRDFDVTIACWVRRQDLFFESGYNQLQKYGKDDLSFREYLQGKHGLADYKKILEPWQRAFSRIKIKPINNNAKDEPAAVTFLNWLDIDFGKTVFDGNTTSNSRAGTKTLAALKYASKELEKIGLELTQNSRQKIIAHYQTSDNSKPNYFRSHEERREFFNSYKNSNDAISKIFLNGETIFEYPENKNDINSTGNEIHLPENDQYLIDFISRLIKKSLKPTA